MGFLNSLLNDEMQDANSGANNTATLAGGADNLSSVSRMQDTFRNTYGFSHRAGLDFGADVADAVPQSTASSALGHAGGILATLGMVNDLQDMTDGSGTSVDEGLSFAGNAMGSASWGLSSLGSLGFLGGTGGFAAGTAAPVLAAGSAGIGLGTMSNSFISDTGLLGDGDERDEYGDLVGRSWSDMIYDSMVSADESAGGGLGGDLLAVGAGLGTSALALGGVLATSPLTVMDGIGDMVGAGANALAGAVVPNPARRADREARSHLSGPALREQRREDRRQRRQDREDVRVATGRGRGHRLLGLGNGT